MDEKYLEYPKKVLKGETVAGELIRLACRRYLSWFGKDDRYFDPKAVDKVVDFIGHLKHSTGRFSSKPFVLSDWQYWMVCACYGFKWKKDGTRCIRTVYIELARKGGKSSLIAALSLYHLMADGEGEPQCVFAANSAAQAQLCFTMAKNYALSLGLSKKYIRQYRSELRFTPLKGTLQIVSADASKLDGKNCSFFCCDELHESDGKVWNVLETSVGMRTQPMSLAITTAGFHMNGFCYRMRESNIKVLNGEKEDDSLFCAIYTMDDGDKIDDKDKWKKSQPNLGVTVSEEYIFQQLNKANNNPSLLVNFKTKTLNIWCANSRGEWLPNKFIEKCSKPFELSSEKFKGLVCTVGVDLSSVSDMTAVSVMIYRPDDETYYFKNYYYLPESALDDSPNKEDYKAWHHMGYLKLTSGNVVDYDEVIKLIHNINATVPIDKIAYDSWQSTSFIITLTEHGFNCEPYSQTIGSMNRPTKHMEMIVRSGKAVFDNNPITKWMFGNCELKEDNNGNTKPVKINKQSSKKIDGVAAMSNALGAYLTTEHYNNKLYAFSIGM